MNHAARILATVAVFTLTSCPLIAEPDVTAQVDNLGCPFSNNDYARNVWDMRFFNGRLYLGHGNSSNSRYGNAGPIPVYYLDPVTDQFIHDQDYTLGEEQIHLFRVFDGELYIPGHDPRDAESSWDRGNLYRLEEDGWNKYRTLTFGVHVYDVYAFGDRLFATLGTIYNRDNRATVLSSADDSLSWERHFETGSGRRYSLFELNNRLYSCYGLMRDPAWATDVMYRIVEYDEGTHRFIDRSDIWYDHMFPGLTEEERSVNWQLQIHRSVNFQDKLLYIAVQPNNDHQGRPVGLFACSSLGDIDTGDPVEAERIQFGPSELVFDVLVKSNMFYALTSEKIEGEPDRFVIRVWQSADLVSTQCLFFLEQDTFAISFEELYGDFYLGLGTDVGTNMDARSYTDIPHPDSGTILRVPRNAYDPGPHANQAPVLTRPTAQTVFLPATAQLAVTVIDDGLPAGTVTTRWTKVSGPGEVTFTPPDAAATSASFSQTGRYAVAFEASDGALASSVSITVTARDPLPEPSLRPLPYSSGLSLWLDAADTTQLELDDNGGVSRWLDKSGHDRHATQSLAALRPEVAVEPQNGWATLDFDGHHYFVDTPAHDCFSAAEGYTVLIAFAAAPEIHGWYGTTYHPLLSTIPKNSHANIKDYFSGPFELTLKEGDGLVHLDFACEDSERNYLQNALGAAHSVAYDTFAVAGATWTGTVSEVYLGTQLVQTATNPAFTGVLTDFAPREEFRIGSNLDGFARFRGKLAEIIVYDHKLPETELESVQQYLREKWIPGVGNQPPAVEAGSGVVLESDAEAVRLGVEDGG